MERAPIELWALGEWREVVLTVCEGSIVGGLGEGDVGVVVGVGVREDAAGDAAVEEEAFGDDVGGVEGGDGEGDDAVEGDGGTEVDEADEAGEGGGDDDGVDGD